MRVHEQKGICPKNWRGGGGKRIHSPGLKKSHFNFSAGDRWVASTTPRKFAHDKKIKNRGWEYGAKKIGYIRKFNFSA